MVDEPPSRTSVPPVGLLERLTSTALDEDYVHVSRRRAETGVPAPRRTRTAALLVLAVFGVLVATAALQTSRNADETARSRASLVEQAQQNRADLAQRRAQLARLDRQIADLQTTRLAAATRAQAEEQRVARLGVLTGRGVTTGPGIEVRVGDAPNASSAKEEVQAPDLQKLVNALWRVGAEAISINGQRLTALSPIRDAAGAITVNFRSLRSPYVVRAIGSSKTMGADLLDTPGGQALLTLESTLGLSFDVDTEGTMTLPAAPPNALRYASDPRDARARDTGTDRGER